MTHRFKNVKISTRLVLCFMIIIALLIAVALSSNYSLRHADRLHRETITYILARRQYVHMMYGEFNEFRLLLRDSYLSAWWIQTTDTEERLRLEGYLTQSHRLMIQYSMSHISLAEADPLITPERAHEVVDYMRETQRYINHIFYQFRDNFFVGSTHTYEENNVESSIARVRYLLGVLRELAETSAAEIHEQTDAIISNTSAVVFVLVLVSIVVALYLAIAMTSAFTNRVKEIANHINQIRTGSISANTKINENDEISDLIAEMSNILHDKEQDADTRVRLMFDATPMSIEYWNKYFQCIDCNQTTLDFYGAPSRDYYLPRCYEIMTDNQEDPISAWKNWNNHLIAAFENGKDTYEYVENDKDGVGRVTLSNAIRISLGDEHVVVTYSQDVTAQREVESERQKSAVAEENSLAKSRFLARMSHEIRTPLTAVLGISEIQLQNPNLSVPVEEAFSKVHNSASILLGLVNDILDLSRIESGKLTIMEDPYEVASLIIDVVQMHMIYLGSKKIDFKVHADENLPAYLIGDELRIRQVLNNLLSNSFKYTESGTVEFEISHSKGSEGIMLEISIRDTGHGMTEEQVKALQTEEYTRFHEREDKNTMGTGLGMSIVYSLLKSMDATLDITSTVGKGTHFLIKLPQGRNGDQVLGSIDSFSATTAKRAKFTPEPMPYGKVLVVDDIDTNLYVARGLLMFYDLEIETCTSGKEAIRKITDGNTYDLVFMDHMMPEMNGVEAMQILRKKNYKQPIVALTANALIGQAEFFTQSGFDGFLPKPIQTAQLNGILNKFIRDKQPQEILDAAREKIAFVPDIDSFMERELNNLRRDFVKGQKHTIKALRAAIDTSDFETAHRLAHTLKGLAGLIQEDALAKTASRAEIQLRNEKLPNIEALEYELTTVLQKIASLGITEEKGFTPSESQVALLDKLQVLLSESDAACIELLPELSQIPETKVLVRQVENFDFAHALVTLDVLRGIF